MNDGNPPLQGHEAGVDHTLEQALDAGGKPFLDFLALIRPAIEAGLQARWDAKLQDLARYGQDVTAMAREAKRLTVRGGKRFRAGLLVAAYKGVAGDAELQPALDAAVAWELLQTYLLIQDDWIDGDPVRRGGPSVHAALSSLYGQAHLGATSAILASDLTFGFALSTLAAANARPEALVSAIRFFCRIHEDVVIGQQIDVLGEADDVEQMHSLKTGSYTTRGPLGLGAILAGASGDDLIAFDRFALPLGIAFQLRDDLLGTFGSQEQTGKPVGSDLRAGKRTALIAWAKERLDATKMQPIERVLGNENATEVDIAEAIGLLDMAGSRQAVEARLSDLCGEAESLSMRLPVSEQARDILKSAASALRWHKP